MKRAHEGKRELLNLPPGPRENFLEFLGEKKFVPLHIRLNAQRQLICSIEEDLVSMNLQYAVCENKSEERAWHEVKWKSRAVNYVSMDLFPLTLLQIMKRFFTFVEYANTMMYWQFDRDVTAQQLQEGPLVFFGRIRSRIPADHAKDTIVQLCPLCSDHDNNNEEEDEQAEEE
jgi:hypothetical protein